MNVVDTVDDTAIQNPCICFRMSGSWRSTNKGGGQQSKMKITVPLLDLAVYKQQVDFNIHDLSLFLFFFFQLLSIMSRNNNSKQKTPLVTHLVAGGAAGLMEACTCHPLDTIKVRMQLSKSGSRSATVSIHTRRR